MANMQFSFRTIFYGDSNVTKKFLVTHLFLCSYSLMVELKCYLFKLLSYFQIFFGVIVYGSKNAVNAPVTVQLKPWHGGVGFWQEYRDGTVQDSSSQP